MSLAIENYCNKFIIFEGGDQTGKSTVCDLFVDFLREFDVNVIKTFQPGDPQHGPLAPLFRSLCKDKRLGLSAEANMFAFLMDRAECCNKIIRPALQTGKTVVCDRHTYSTIAFQLYGKELLKQISESCGHNQAVSLLEWFKNPYPDLKPDIVYYFPLKVGKRSIDENDFFETAGDAFTERVHKAYETMAKCHNWKIVMPGKNAEVTLENLLNL